MDNCENKLPFEAFQHRVQISVTVNTRRHEVSPAACKLEVGESVASRKTILDVFLHSVCADSKSSFCSLGVLDEEFVSALLLKVLGIRGYKIEG